MHSPGQAPPACTHLSRQRVRSVALLLSASLARAALVEYWVNITYTQANPDGLYERRVIGVNGTWPPPPVEVNRNDSLLVHAYNGIDQPVSLHHHGIYFNASLWYDGAVGVTQCGIPPGYSFTYEVPVSDQWGTYWQHSHNKGQYVDGLRAPFIIHNKPEPYVYDEEFTVVMSDWYHDEHSVLLDQFINVANPTGAEPVPNSALMYFSQNGRYLPGFNENATLPFQAGKTYRLRLINTGAFAMFYFRLMGHTMTVIEVDGTDVEPYETDLITITVAQRYSILVKALNDTTQNWPIQFNFDSDMFDTVPDDLALNYTSSVVYDSSFPLADVEMIPEYHDFDDVALVPLIIEASAPADRQIPLNVWFDTMDTGVNRAMFMNTEGQNITYDQPIVPSIFTALTMGDDAANPVVYGQTNPYILDHLQNIELQIFNWDAGKHPFHLHGYKFQIIRKSQDVTSDDPLINPPLVENQANPIRRDTVQIPSGGLAVVRFRADNPGVSFFHCHIDWHLSAGLAVTFINSVPLLQSLPGPPSFISEQCAVQGIPSSGNAAGWNSTSDFTGLTVGPYTQIPGFHAKGRWALAGTILAALVGMATVFWYGFGGQLDEDELDASVKEAMEKKAARGGGYKKRAFAKLRRVGQRT
ncbi:uncharacterized protein L969DRAFT_91292 [Mixia osmundae IAM 14324]|uniref:uncharacterized protein n=1 Tax=Mixia osmundae (strain CBS 9802 / IAM 14324 / JCM 22182 / KY 12970) TaxID=764103 RepID=UPI0004A5508F|nr:uncharacterized protein L969DRAFT_91292 [Mixia osmundae IAM 14324]KEI41811.1 hypothetical protein L969DRAFT_91292 [Mixia osmundae IAM 14324]